jgi:hypothetical protein
MCKLVTTGMYANAKEWAPFLPILECRHSQNLNTPTHHKEVVRCPFLGSMELLSTLEIFFNF